MSKYFPLKQENTGWGDLAQCGKHLPCKREAWCLDPRTPANAWWWGQSACDLASEGGDGSTPYKPPLHHRS